MLDLNSLFEFSRNNCVAICTFLVPANLLATLQTLVWVGFNRSPSQTRWVVTVASCFALIMILHVFTWLMIGVVRIPTFVLFGLGCTCLGINGWAIAHSTSLATLLRRVRGVLSFE